MTHSVWRRKKEETMTAIVKLEEEQHKKAEKTPLATLEKKVDEASKGRSGVDGVMII